jgi:hypothetical protein
MHYPEAINITLSGTPVQITDNAAFAAMKAKYPKVLYIQQDADANGPAYIKFTGAARTVPGSITDTTKTYKLAPGAEIKIDEEAFRGDKAIRCEGFDLRDIYVAGTAGDVLTVRYGAYYPGLE